MTDYVPAPFEPTDLLYKVADVYPEEFPRWWWLERLQAALSFRAFLMTMAMVVAKRKREEER